MTEPTPMSMSNLELPPTRQQGASADIEGIYRQHHSWLIGWLQRRMGCSQHAADLAQDTFLSLLNQQLTQPIHEPRSFLATIARRLSANHYRRRSLEEAYLQALALVPEAVTPSPEVQYLALEALCQIDQALDGLPARAREAFLLAHLQGVKQADIAQRLGVSLRTIKNDLVLANQQCFFSLQP